MLRTLCLSLALTSAPSPSSAGEAIEVVNRVVPGSVMRVETTRNAVQTIQDVRMQIAGKTIDLGLDASTMLGGPRRRELVARHLDRVLEAADGRATRLERRYDALRTRSIGADEDASRAGDGAQGGADGPSAGRAQALLRGRALVLTVAPDGTLTAEALDGAAALSPRLALGHAPLSVTDAFLPDGPVAVGDHWSVQGSPLAALFQGGGEPLFATDATQPLLGTLCERMWERAEIVGDVALVAVRERAGLRCAVIEYNLGVLTVLENVDPVAAGVAPESLRAALPVGGAMRVGIAGEVRGRLWLALDERRPVANEAELEARFRGTVALSAARSECTIEGVASETRTTTWTPLD